MRFWFRFAALSLAGCALFPSVDGLSGDAGQDSVADVSASDADAGQNPYVAEVLADGPIAYYALDETSGATASSLVPGAPVGTFTKLVTWGAPALISKGGTSATFSALAGSDSDLSFGNVFAFAGTAPFSIEAWIQPTKVDGFYRHVMSKADRVSDMPVNGWNLCTLGATSGTSIEVWLERFSSGVQVSTPHVSITPDVRAHVVAVYTGSALVLYVDGAPTTPVADTASVGGTTTNAFLGSANGGVNPGHGFIGNIDEVAVYDKALAPERVTAHWIAGM